MPPHDGEEAVFHCGGEANDPWHREGEPKHCLVGEAACAAINALLIVIIYTANSGICELASITDTSPEVRVDPILADIQVE